MRVRTVRELGIPTRKRLELTKGEKAALMRAAEIAHRIREFLCEEYGIVEAELTKLDGAARNLYHVATDWAGAEEILVRDLLDDPVGGNR
jgi:hypothetical protein